MKLNDLIRQLEQVKKQVGNVEILFSSDPEGNTFGDLGKKVLRVEQVNKSLIAVFPEHTIYADELDA